MDVAVVDLGQVRGLALFRAKASRFRHVVDTTFFVPSASGTGGYIVDSSKATCSCPAHEDTGARCKHLWAIAYFRRELEAPGGESVVSKTAVRLTYAQDWPRYNAAQCEEKDVAQALLRSLCDGLSEPVQTMGRPRIPIGDAVYAAAMKVYVGTSSRRATSDLRACQAAGYVDRTPDFSSVCRTMERADLTPVLRELVEQSARPLRAIETTFAADSTGFSTSTYGRWFDKKYGEEKRYQRWIKVHAMVGTLTNVFVAVNVTENEGPGTGDSPNFPDLVERTAASGFEMREVSADKAYLSRENLAAVERTGAVPFVPFKIDSQGSSFPAWDRMWHLFSLQRDEFMQRYHRRSNVESSFSAVKRKFGTHLRSKKLEAQLNEALLKCLCFNLSMLVHSIHELGIEPKFWMPKESRA